MASASNSQPLIKFKCHICKAIPAEEDVNQCSRGHILCLKCCTKKGRKCECKSVNLVKVPNPILRIVKTTKQDCPYKEQGCSWKVSEADDMDQHCGECKFRPYKCVGTQLGVWNCAWSGTQQDFYEHMKESHEENGVFFTHYQQGTVDFNPMKKCMKFNLIDAFNKKFAFLYMSHDQNPNVMFIIYLLGRKCDAQKFMIDFELRGDDMRKIKMIETCHSDAANIGEIISEHRCFILPKKTVETYSKNMKLEFRFVIKRKDDIKSENVEKQQHRLSNAFRGSVQSLAVHNTTPKLQIKGYPSESNLVLTAPYNNRSNGQANYKPKYRRNVQNK